LSFGLITKDSRQLSANNVLEEGHYECARATCTSMFVIIR
jgi:hypothetical protein